MNLSKKILSWYDNNKRTLPWRINQKSTKNQYYRILSEFMLQQTQVKTVIPYFNNFVKNIPDLKTLSQSSDKTILKLWEGLGYYRRAKNLRKTSKILVKKYNSKIPNKFEDIKKLPGVGDYTANILLALIYNQPRIGIDANVKRVFERLFDKNLINSKDVFKKYFFNNRNGDLAEAIMEFGAVLCKPKNPDCNICSLKIRCIFYKKKGFNTIEKKISKRIVKYNIYCYLKKKQIALTKNKSLGFLNNFKVPRIQLINGKHIKKSNGWVYLCNYKNSISNIKMDINLFYKFTTKKPKFFKWYYIEGLSKEFIPSFTKKIINKVNKII